MNLGDELRAALNQEADMQPTTAPDVDRLIIGGRGRRRQRNLTRAVVSGPRRRARRQWDLCRDTGRR